MSPDPKGGRHNRRNKFNFWSVHGIMNTPGILQSQRQALWVSLTLQETRSVHDSMNRPKTEFLKYMHHQSFFKHLHLSDPKELLAW